MGSLYLQRQSPDDRSALIAKLHQSQHSKCFICEQAIDLVAHKGKLDIDHVVPTKANGKDDPSNFALTHSSCNRSKQASHLEVARVLSRFARLGDSLAGENRNPNLGDLLHQAAGQAFKLGFNLSGDALTYSFSELGDNALRTVPVYVDDMSGFRYFFAKLPIQYLAHDAHINPRSIGSNRQLRLLRY